MEPLTLGIWSLLAARVPGTMMGIAPNATFLLAKTEDVRSETPLEEDTYVAALEWADSLGARVIVSAVVFRYDFTDRLPTAYAAMNGDSTVTTRVASRARCGTCGRLLPIRRSRSRTG